MDEEQWVHGDVVVTKNPSGDHWRVSAPWIQPFRSVSTDLVADPFALATLVDVSRPKGRFVVSNDRVYDREIGLGDWDYVAAFYNGEGGTNPEAAREYAEWMNSRERS